MGMVSLESAKYPLSSKARMRIRANYNYEQWEMLLHFYQWGLKLKDKLKLFKRKYSTTNLYTTGFITNCLDPLSWNYVASEGQLFIHKRMLDFRQQEVVRSGFGALSCQAGMRSLRSSDINENSLNKRHQERSLLSMTPDL